MAPVEAAVSAAQVLLLEEVVQEGQVPFQAEGEVVQVLLLEEEVVLVAQNEVSGSSSSSSSLSYTSSILKDRYKIRLQVKIILLKRR